MIFKVLNLNADDIAISTVSFYLPYIFSAPGYRPIYSGVARGGQLGASAPGRQGLGAPK